MVNGTSLHWLLACEQNLDQKSPLECGIIGPCVVSLATEYILEQIHLN